MSIYKLIQIDSESEFLSQIVSLIVKYDKLLFSYTDNAISEFIKSLHKREIQLIGAIENDKLFAFLALYNFRRIFNKYFSCYMYGAAERKSAAKIQFLFPYILRVLKEQGCKSLRFETYRCNLPMRFLAQRLFFRKVGVLQNASFVNGKFIDNILYEKKL